LKEKLLEIFHELLNEWEESETVAINEFGSSIETDPYERLEKKKQDYIKKFNEALEKNN
jgi:hypothetical protein